MEIISYKFSQFNFVTSILFKKKIFYFHKFYPIYVINCGEKIVYLFIDDDLFTLLLKIYHATCEVIGSNHPQYLKAKK